jgi:hypothetical protein
MGYLRISIGLPLKYLYANCTTNTLVLQHKQTYRRTACVGFLPDGHRYARSDRIAAGKGSGNPYEEVL